MTSHSLSPFLLHHFAGCCRDPSLPHLHLRSRSGNAGH